MTSFEKDLTNLLNRNCKENDSDTPDFLLAEYLVGCLDLYSTTVMKREKWYGRGPQLIEGVEVGDGSLPPHSTAVAGREGCDRALARLRQAEAHAAIDETRDALDADE